MEETNRTTLEIKCIVEADTLINIAKSTIRDKRHLIKKMSKIKQKKKVLKNIRKI